jgi:formyl-CoA transferase
MLAQLGAEVIKVEEPGVGDASRQFDTMWGSSMALPGGRNLFMETPNRDKKSITLDLRQEEGRQIFYELVGKGDVFLTNYRPSTLCRMGAEYETLRQVNPRLIYTLASPVGPRGPITTKRFFDPLAQALSGVMWMMGDRDHDEPWQVVGGLFDQTGATMAAWGILAALLHRERTGEGQRVEVSLLGTALHMQAINVNTALMQGRAMGRHSRARARNPMSNHYRCADSKWIILAEPQSDRYWAELCLLLEREDLALDPELDTAVKRRENFQVAVQGLEEAFATRPRDEWVRIFDENGCQFGYAPVLNMEEAVQHPQAVESGYVVDLQDEEGNPWKLVGPPVHFEKTPARPRGLAPRLGEHTDEVLRGILGYSPERIAEVREAGLL